MSRDAFFPGLVSVVRIVILWCSAFWLFTMTEYGEIYGPMRRLRRTGRHLCGNFMWWGCRP